MSSNVLIKHKNIFYLLLIPLFLGFPSKIYASVLINEISPSTETEWIELYNDGNTPVDLSGYLLEDGNASKTDDLNLSGIIPANGFLVFNHNEGWLNNGGDTIKLYNNASPSAVIDQYTYVSVDATKSIARIPNGSENWQVTSNITNSSSNPNPTVAPTVSPTNSPTQEPTTAPTSTPTVKPAPTKSPTAKPTISPTPTEEPEPSEEPDEETQTLDELETNIPTATGLVAGASTENKSKTVAIVFIVLGTILLGYCGYLIYNIKNAKVEDNS